MEKEEEEEEKEGYVEKAKEKEVKWKVVRRECQTCIAADSITELTRSIPICVGGGGGGGGRGIKRLTSLCFG